MTENIIQQTKQLIKANINYKVKIVTNNIDVHLGIYEGKIVGYKYVDKCLYIIVQVDEYTGLSFDWLIRNNFIICVKNRGYFGYRLVNIKGLDELKRIYRDAKLMQF